MNTEAKLLMLRHAFDALGANRVEFKTDALNTVSRAAILRLGATEEGTFRRHMIVQGGRVRDTVYFSIVDRDWPARPRPARGHARPALAAIHGIQTIAAPCGGPAGGVDSQGHSPIESMLPFHPEAGDAADSPGHKAWSLAGAFLTLLAIGLCAPASAGPTAGTRATGPRSGSGSTPCGPTGRRPTPTPAPPPKPCDGPPVLGEVGPADDARRPQGPARAELWGLAIEPAPIAEPESGRPDARGRPRAARPPRHLDLPPAPTPPLIDPAPAPRSRPRPGAPR